MRTTASSGRRASKQIARLVVALAVVGGLLLTACSGRAAGPQGTGQAGTQVADDVVHRDLAYGPDPDQSLDVYATTAAHNAPILLMVHGGGWTRGDKAAAGVVDNKVAHYLPAGYVVVSTNYRFSPQVDPITQAQDVATALKFVQTNATAWGGDPSRIVLMGHSAGANLVALVTADPTYRAQAGATPWLGTIALDSAAYDVPQIMQAPHLPLYDNVFDHDERLQQAASPTLVIAGTPEPVLLVCGSGRSNACPQADAFAAAVRAHGSTATVLPFDLSHGDIDSQVGLPGPLTTAIDRFLGSLGLPT